MTQTGAFKQAIERISNVITDCCLVFVRPDENTDDGDDGDDEIEDIEEEPEQEKDRTHLSKNKSKKTTESDDDDNDQMAKPTKSKKSKKNTESDDDNDQMANPTKSKKSTKSTKPKSRNKKTKSDPVDSDPEEEIADEEIKTGDKIKTNDKKKTSAKALVAKSSSKGSSTDKKNKGGIRILRLTEDKSILIKLSLDADSFAFFKCDEPKITIGVDMQNLHALLKMVNDNYPIILYMNKDNQSALYIRSLNEDNKSSEETDIEVYLMDIGNPEMPIPRTEFQNKITMASDKFHNICKHMNNNSTYVEIASVDNEISFRGRNEGGKVTMFYRDSNFPMKKNMKTKKVVQGVYELKNLMSFSKCNKLCETVEIYLRNDFPLVLVISVANLGKMYIFLSPVEHPNQ